ncbi:MAG: exonuclease SbcCD subunit D C-terminal domain-containing protein [Bacteroidetes bacterium]|nr:exonuclease SbcCD subunit D C-terminal domain-containing protein [Bacteroidota bacterium]
MKIIHTADWHLGQRFYNNDRTEEHKHFFEWLIDQIKENDVDVLLAAGDIFDIYNPSNIVLSQYYDFIVDLTRQIPKLQVIIIAGNHDSARIEVDKILLETVFPFSIVGTIDDYNNIDLDKHIIPLRNRTNGEIEAVCLAVPYLSSSDRIKPVFTKLIDAAKEKYSGLPLIAMGHFYATGAEIAEKHSERVVVGGIDSVELNDYDIDNSVIYTALGHIHKSQKVNKKDNIRYSGSPIPLSFSEINYNHGVNLIEIDKNNNSKLIFNRLEYIPKIKLISIPKDTYKTFKEVIEDLKEYNGSEKGYLQIKVKANEEINRNQIDEIIKDKNLIFCRADVEPVNIIENNMKSEIQDMEQFEELTPMKFFEKLLNDKHEQIENDCKSKNIDIEDLKKVFESIVDEVKGE